MEKVADDLSASRIFSKGAPSSHIMELDGVRGIAVSMVILGHGVPQLGLFAVSGVSLFFVLSGFLITRILIRSMRRPKYFRNFYIRRFIRIWPLYYLILGIAFLILRVPSAQNPPYLYLLYIQNFGDMVHAAPILGPTWSLAIEEQFYLMWPLVIWLFQSARKTIYVSVCLVCLAPLVRVLYSLHGIDPYGQSLARIDGLAMGAGLAALSILQPAASRGLKIMLVACVTISLALLPLLHYTLLRKAFKDTSSSLLFLCIIAVAYFWSGKKVVAILRNPVLLYMGKISYCAYLVHLALIYRFGFPIALVMTILIASASWYGFEKPLLAWKDRITT